jgi:hypothetical protein
MYIVIARPRWQKNLAMPLSPRSACFTDEVFFFLVKSQTCGLRTTLKFWIIRISGLSHDRIKKLFCNTQIKTLHSLQLHTPLLILCSLSPDSTITNIHIFLSLSYCFLLLAGWWLSYSSRCFLPLWESQNICTHYFHSSEDRIFSSATISDAITGHSVSSCKQTNLTGVAWNHCEKKKKSANFLIKLHVNKGNTDHINVNHVAVLWAQHYQYF